MTRRLAVLALSVVALTGCGTGDVEVPPETPTATTQEAQTPMSDAKTLKENLPTEVGGVRLIAYNIRPDRAGLHLGPDQRTIRLDETITVDGTDYTVAELVPSDPARGDHSNGWVSLTSE